MSPLLCFSCLPARIWMLLITEGTFIAQLINLPPTFIWYFWIVKMVTRVIYMDFASSTKPRSSLPTGMLWLLGLLLCLTFGFCTCLAFIYATWGGPVINWELCRYCQWPDWCRSKGKPAFGVTGENWACGRGVLEFCWKTNLILICIRLEHRKIWSTY